MRRGLHLDMNPDYEVRYAKQTGGKAGKGCNKTSSVQVLHNSCIVKIFRFTVGDTQGRISAKLKADEYARYG